MKKLRLSLIAFFMFFSLVCLQILWAADADLTQVISDGTLGVDIVDDLGDSVASPSFALAEKAFSFDAQDATGTLATSTQKIRLSNPTATDTWNVTMAATGGTGSTWTAGSFTYPYNAASADDGRLTVNPTTGTITGLNGCATTNVSTSASAYFEGATTTSITLMSASAGADVGCRWDLTGVGLTQRIPAAQPPGSYSIGMTLTAN